ARRVFVEKPTRGAPPSNRPPPRAVSCGRSEPHAAMKQTRKEEARPEAGGDGHTAPAEEQIAALQEEALRHTRLSLEHMARHGVRPEGRVALFLPPEARQQEIHRLPYRHAARQVVVYETEPGEFSALCPFSGLPDFGTVRIEYVPGSWLDRKSTRLNSSHVKISYAVFC